MKLNRLSLLILLSLVITGCNQSTPDSSSEEHSSDISSESKESYIDIYTESSIEDSSIDPASPVASISITPPTKTTYEVGDDLDLTGLKVSVTYKDGTSEDVDISKVNISSYDKNVKGTQTVKVKYEEAYAHFIVTVIRNYNELPDSTEGIDVSDLSDLYNAFKEPLTNYTSTSESFFNERGVYDYYRNYQKNYVQEKVSIYTETSQYTYPIRSEFLDIMNTGYVNINKNYYAYSLKGDDINTRLASKVTTTDLTVVKEESHYQDDMFTLADINESYFTIHPFTRISEYKYECTSKEVLNDFIDIVAPTYINKGAYMTFARVTIELNPMDNVSMRIRIYANSTQSGRIVSENLDKEYRGNWYMLFSEALISNIGSTSFTPTNGLFS